MRLPLTPPQTIGPFFHDAFPRAEDTHVVAPGTDGAVWLRGRVLDGTGGPVDDALVETWQADPDGRFNHPDDPRGAVPGFRGFGRSATDLQGSYAILTVKPGVVPGPEGVPQAPHVDVSVFARGLLHRVVTRVYFSDEASANEADPVLSERVDDRRRSTLIADVTEDGYRFDIHLQGTTETVFFRV